MYAVTAFFELRSISGNLAKGWAGPYKGPRCSCLEIWSGDLIVAAVRADLHDPIAADIGKRDGWCGFELRILESYFIHSDRLTIRCAVSHEKLWEIGIENVKFERHNTREKLTLESLLSIELDRKYQNIDIFRPMFNRMSAQFGAERFVDFLYQFLLGRKPDRDGSANYVSIAKKNPGTVVDALIQSDEFKFTRRSAVCGPFSTEFPYFPIFDSDLL